MNKFNHLNKVLFGSLTVGALLANPLASFAANQADADAIALSCASAIDVMGCIRETQGFSAPQTQSLSDTGNMAKSMATQQATSAATGVANKLFGPVQIGLRYDSDLSWIADLGYSHQIGDFAAALKASVGMNELRGNATLGYALTKNQQVKMTYEYLRQNLPFEFTSGNINQWVSQQAFGAAYRYVFNNSKLQSLEVYGSYAKANSKELSDAYIYDANNVLDQINQRRIAGGEEKNAGANVTFLPFKNTSLKVGGGYSTLSFDHKDGFTAKDGSTVKDTSAIAYNAEINHVLGDKTMLTTSVSNTASARSHTAKVSQILPGNLEASLVGQYNFSHTSIPDNGSVTANLSYPAPKSYSANFAAALGDLKTWVETPVVHYSRVLAVAEERLIAAKISTSAIPDQIVQVGNTMNPAIETNKYFSYNKEAYNNINYNIVSIVDKTDTSKHLSAADLGLKVTKENNYDARIESATVMPTNALAGTPIKSYVMTIEAEGIRNGTAISRVDNTVNVIVGQDTSQPANAWNATSNTFATAYVGTAYSQPINPSSNPRIKNNTTIKDESYTYYIQGTIPSWLVVNNINGNLESIKGATPDKAETVSFQLKAVSNSTGQTVTPEWQNFSFTVVEANAPRWNQTCTLPATDVGNSVSGDLSQCVSVSGNGTLSFEVDPDSSKTKPSSANGWNFTSGTILNGTPNDASVLDQSNKSISVPVIAHNNVNSKDYAAPGTVTIQINQNKTLVPPTEDSANNQLSEAIENSASYNSGQLNKLFVAPLTANPTIVNENYGYKATFNCSGFDLGVKNSPDNANQKVYAYIGMNSGKVPAVGTACQVNITATSNASGNSNSAPVTRNINISQTGIIWTKSIFDQPLVYQGGAGGFTTYQSIDNTFVSGAGGATVTSVTADASSLPPYIQVATASTAYLTLNADTGNAQISNVNANCNSMVNLTANGAADGNPISSPNLILACLQPNTSLKEPQWNGSAQINAYTNQAISNPSLVPVKTSAYVIPTSVDGTAATAVADVYSYYRLDDNGYNGSCSKGDLSLDPTTGILSGLIKNAGTCTFKFSVDSKARDKTSTITGKINVTAPPPPVWIVKNPIGSITLVQGNNVNNKNVHTGGIPITTSATPGVGSNFMIDLKGADFANINVTVENVNDSKSKWAISRDVDNNMFYLFRPPFFSNENEKLSCPNPNGCYDAKDITTYTSGSPANVGLRLQLDGNNVSGESGLSTFMLAVTPESNIYPWLYMPGGSALSFVATVGGDQARQLIVENTNNSSYLNRLKTFYNNSLILNDAITMDSADTSNQNRVGNPKAITYSNSSNPQDQRDAREIGYIERDSTGATYNLVINSASLNNSTDPGSPGSPASYGTVLFHGIKSTAMGPGVSKDWERFYNSGGEGDHVYTTIYPGVNFLQTLPPGDIEVAGDSVVTSARAEGINYMNINRFLAQPYSDLSQVKDLDIVCAVTDLQNPTTPVYDKNCGNFSIKQVTDNSNSAMPKGWYIVRRSFSSADLKDKVIPEKASAYSASDMSKSWGGTSSAGNLNVWLQATYTSMSNNINTTVTVKSNPIWVNLYPYSGTEYRVRWDADVGGTQFTYSWTTNSIGPQYMAGSSYTPDQGGYLKLAGKWDNANYFKTCSSVSDTDKTKCGLTYIVNDYTYLANIDDAQKGGLAGYLVLDKYTPNHPDWFTGVMDGSGDQYRQLYVFRNSQPAYPFNIYKFDNVLGICKGNNNSNDISNCANHTQGAVNKIAQDSYQFTIARSFSSALADSVNNQNNTVSSPGGFLKIAP